MGHITSELNFKNDILASLSEGHISLSIMKLLSFFKQVKSQSDKMSEDLAISVTKKLIEDKTLSDSISEKVALSLGPIIDKAIRDTIETELKKKEEVKLELN